MSKRSDRKWAAKEQRADAVREDAGSLREKVSNANRLSKAAKASGTSKDHAAAAAAHREVASHYENSPAGRGAKSLIEQNYAQQEKSTHERLARAHDSASTSPSAGAMDSVPRNPRAANPMGLPGRPSGDGPREVPARRTGAERPKPMAAADHDEVASRVRGDDPKLADKHEKMAKEMREHREVGEMHLSMAKGHQEASKALSRALGRVPETRSFGPGSERLSKSIEEHEGHAKEHLAKAAEHAAAAGGEWDEGKHPRDENGKFA